MRLRKKKMGLRRKKWDYDGNEIRAGNERKMRRGRTFGEKWIIGGKLESTKQQLLLKQQYFTEKKLNVNMDDENANGTWAGNERKMRRGRKMDHRWKMDRRWKMDH